MGRIDTPEVFSAAGRSSYASTPPKPLAEMKALAEPSGVEATTLPGSLAFYDEYPRETAAVPSPFSRRRGRDVQLLARLSVGDVVRVGDREAWVKLRLEEMR